MNILRNTRTRPMATPIPGIYEARAKERAEREAALASRRKLLQQALVAPAPVTRKRRRGTKVDTVAPKASKRIVVSGVLEFHGRSERRDPHGTELMTCYQALITTVDGRSQVFTGSVNDLGRALLGVEAGQYIELAAIQTGGDDIENYTLK